MKNAFLRLILIALSSMLILATILFALRQLGALQEFAALKHPLADREFWLIADRAGDASLISSTQSTCPECLIQLDLRRSLDEIWFVTNDLAAALKMSDELESTGGQTVSDVLKSFPDQPFVLVIHSRDASQLSSLLDQIKSREKKQNLVIQSPFRQILTDARERRPQWLFGIAPGSITRVLLMESLYIETMADIWADVFITPLKLAGRDALSPRLVKELDRRKKILILDVEKDFSSIPKYILDSTDGVITPHIEEAKRFFTF